MLKKTILALLLVGFTGVLIWGGVNRTLAKSGENKSNSATSTGRGNQNWTADHNPEDCDDGLGVVSANENGNQPETESEHLGLALTDGTDKGAASQGQGNQSRANGGQGGASRATLDATEIEALYIALDDEYYALAVYQSVIDAFGLVEPFVEIAASEERHIGALVNQLNKNDLAIPENPWLGTILPFESVEQACATGVQAEIDNAGLYDQLFSMTDDASLIRVFTNLSNASLNSHLPLFEACQ